MSNKRKLTKQQQRRIAQKQKQHTQQTQDYDDSDTLTGRVINHHGRKLIVETDEKQHYTCKLRQNLGDIVCGDIIIFEPDTTTDAEQHGVIIAVKERTNYLEKTGFGGKAKPVAANIDQVAIVCALEPEPNLYLVDRYLVATENLPANAVIVLNKIDLLNESSQHIVDKLKSTYEPTGYRVILTSALEYNGIDELKTILKNTTSILVGLSGVGKSSLVKDLLPDTDIKIGDISTASGEGKHTTTVSSLYHLPDGGELIDSPGVRDFTPHNLSKEDTLNGFIELRKYRGQCKFANCTHTNEPECAIKEALEKNEVSKQRVESFQRMLAESND